MSETKIYPVPGDLAKSAWCDESGYFKLYEQSVKDPEGFWGEQGKRIDWIKPYSQVKDVSFGPENVHIKWYPDGTLNASANCLDRHLEARGDQTAIIWEGDDPNDSKAITYRELHEQVCRLGNAMKNEGVKKGDRVTIYMPMIPEAAVAMLACARIGAVHSVVFGGFSPDSLGGRIQDCDSNCVITADEGVRGGRKIPLKANTDAALKTCPTVEKVIVVKRTGGDIDWVEGRDVWYHEVCGAASADCPAEEMNAEDPLFILYTSGSTGKPKGVLHTTGGYMVYTSITHQYVFDYHDGEVFWCTADVGWVTGHSYIVYGPLANGAISVMFEGVPNYPDASRFWQVCDKHKVNIFYTAPTAIRALMREGDGPVTKTDRGSIRLLGTVGEPINPEAWIWYYDVVGGGRCPIVDTWWQTETGGILITPLPGATPLKPGSATRPFFGVRPVLVDNNGKEMEGAAPRPLRADLLLELSGQVLHRRRLPARRGRLLLDHRPGRRRDQRLRPPHGHRRGGKRPGRPPSGGGSGRGRRAARHQGPGHLRLRHAQCRRGGLAAVGAGPAQDALGQDHAAHPAQDRRRRLRQSGRHLDPGRPRRRGRPGREPAEPQLRAERPRPP
jgi:acetyl-CoA synthetase